MKLRYYLRGIGIGIIVASAICICASVNKGKMTDAEIIAKAKELGMTSEGTLLADVAEEQLTEIQNEESVQEDKDVNLATDESMELTTEEASAEVMETENEAELETESETEPVIAEAESEAIETAATETATSTQDKSEEKMADTTEVIDSYVVVVIEKGNGSDTVARKLYDLGVVSDAIAYDKYLCANGYDRRISAGSHEIPKGASDEQIAKIICRMN